MALGTILLHLPGWLDDTTPPGVQFNADMLPELLFDSASEELVRWRVNMPENYASGLKMIGTITMASANTTDGVVLGGRVQAITPDNNESFSTGGYSTQAKDRVVVDDDAGQTVSFEVSLNDDGAVPDDEVIFEFSRVGNDTTTETSGDDATGDMVLTSIKLEYTTT